MPHNENSKTARITITVSKREKDSFKIQSEKLNLDESDFGRVLFLGGLAFLTRDFNDLSEKEINIIFRERIWALTQRSPIFKKPTIREEEGINFLLTTYRKLKGGGEGE